jgi:hypothetical protein
MPAAPQFLELQQLSDAGAEISEMWLAAGRETIFGKKNSNRASSDGTFLLSCTPFSNRAVGAPLTIFLIVQQGAANCKQLHV